MKSCYSFLKTLSLILLWQTVIIQVNSNPVPQSVQAINDEFVRVDPSDRRYFILKGKRFRFQGANQHDLGISLQPSQIQQVMQQNQQLGLKVVRIWAFNENNCGITGCFVYFDENNQLQVNDEAMKRLDYVLYYASQYGLKVILVPVNFETSYGGMLWWVQKIRGADYPKQTFYTDDQIQTSFKKYLFALTNRVNSLTGIRYSQDPTVFAWNTANEPHTPDGADPTGTIVGTWICSISKYMKEVLGVQQMVTSGEEGYQTQGNLDGANKNHEWVQNGLKGVDFATNVKCPYLDYATVHLYPDNWGIPPNEFVQYIQSFLKERVQLAFNNGKPVVVEEFGCCLDQRYKGLRSTMFSNYLSAFDQNNIAGQLVWQLYPSDYPRRIDLANYDFTPSTDDDNARTISNAANAFH